MAVGHVVRQDVAAAAGRVLRYGVRVRRDAVRALGGAVDGDHHVLSGRVVALPRVVRRRHSVGNVQRFACRQIVERFRTGVEGPVDRAAGVRGVYHRVVFAGAVIDCEHVRQHGFEVVRKSDRGAGDTHEGALHRHGVAGVNVSQRECAAYGGGRVGAVDRKPGTQFRHGSSRAVSADYRNDRLVVGAADVDSQSLCAGAALAVRHRDGEGLVRQRLGRTAAVVRQRVYRRVRVVQRIVVGAIRLDVQGAVLACHVRHNRADGCCAYLRHQESRTLVCVRIVREQVVEISVRHRQPRGGRRIRSLGRGGRRSVVNEHRRVVGAADRDGNRRQAAGAEAVRRGSSVHAGVVGRLYIISKCERVAGPQEVERLGAGRAESRDA